MKIYTRSGDGGRTGLFGGRRVVKHHGRLEAYGALDELNAHLGLFAAGSDDGELTRLAREIQDRLFDLGAHLATPSEAAKAAAVLPDLHPSLVEDMERTIDRLESDLPPLTQFVLPGGNEDAARLHVARAVCRRAERATSRLGARTALHPVVLPYLNRLSDLLFVMARTAVLRAGDREIPWTPKRPE